MELKNQVCSLEISRRLKELGVKQESYFTWYKHLNDDDNNEIWTLNGKENKPYANPMYSTFTVAELGEMLPFFVNKWHVWAGQLMCVRHPNHWTVSYGTMKDVFCKESADTEADARGKMLIYLIENSLLPLSSESNEPKK